MTYKRRSQSKEKDAVETQSPSEFEEAPVMAEETNTEPVEVPVTPAEVAPWQKRKVLLIVGDGTSLNEDLSFLRHLPEYDVMAIDAALTEYPGPVTYHASWRDYDDINMAMLLHAYASSRRTPLRECFSFFGGKGATRIQPPYPSGCSTLYGALVGALHLGYTKIVVCNAPQMADSESEDNASKTGWQAAFPALRDVVRSVSGQTKTLFGEPTQEWLDS